MINYKGKYISSEQFKSVDLVSTAVKLEEPETIEDRHSLSFKIIPMIFVIIYIAIAIKDILYGPISIQISYLGILAFFPFIYVHEFLHAVGYGINDVIDLYLNPKNFSVFITSTAAISRERYILMLFLPNIALGLIPLVVWTFLPYNNSFLFTFAIMELLGGISDYLQIITIMCQVPKGKTIQNSSKYTYWY